MTKKLGAEFLGTAWLVFGGCGSASWSWAWTYCLLRRVGPGEHGVLTIGTARGA